MKEIQMNSNPSLVKSAANTNPTRVRMKGEDFLNGWLDGFLKYGPAMSKEHRTAKIRQMLEMAHEHGMLEPDE